MWSVIYNEGFFGVVFFAESAKVTFADSVIYNEVGFFAESAKVTFVICYI
jgi:hypothetical protein